MSLPPQTLALGRFKTGVMNKTEAAYAEHLKLEQRCGGVVWFLFEGIKLRLADNTFYTPDFVVMNTDRTLELHECKGRWTDDARVKIKVAAERFPFRFIAVYPHMGGWRKEEF